MAEHLHGVELGRDGDLGRARCPPPRRVDLGDDEAVVVEHGAHLGVTVSVVGPGVVTPPQRDGVAPRAGGGLQALAKACVARDGARAQHERVGPECHTVTCHRFTRRLPAARHAPRLACGASISPGKGQPKSAWNAARAFGNLPSVMSLSWPPAVSLYEKMHVNATLLAAIQLANWLMKYGSSPRPVPSLR